MANEKPTTPTLSRPTDKASDRAGLIMGIAALAIDSTDKSSTVAYGLAQDVRGELRVAADTSIDAIEALVRGFFRIGKRATARIDELAGDLIGAGERTTAGVFRGLRDTTRAAADLATTAAGAIVGSDRPNAQA
jgi:hypothetical protein